MTRIRQRNSIASHHELTETYIAGNVDREYVFLIDREKTTDEVHRWKWFQEALNTPSGDFYTFVEMGGEFTSRKTTAKLVSSSPVVLKDGSYKGNPIYTFRGPLIPSRPSRGSLRGDVVVPYPLIPGADVTSIDAAHNDQDGWTLVSETDEELALLGAKLVSSLSPKAPHNNVYTSLGELRNDGLPLPFASLIRSGKLSEKLSGEYLNYQFGIAPTISDIKGLRKTVEEADKLWKQYLRDSGRLVRRRYNMDPETSVVTEAFHTHSGALPPVGTRPGMWGSVGPLMRTTRTTRKRWFSAAYLYYVDQSSLQGMAGFLEKSDYLFGWKPTLSGQYNLTPWSWLLDWFTNTGDVVDNVSMYLEDPFLTRWAYIMEETTVTRNIYQQLVDNTGAERLAQLELTTSLKKRRRVNPFHFGLTEEALDSRQLSILAALGMTKGRNPGTL